MARTEWLTSWAVVYPSKRSSVFNSVVFGINVVVDDSVVVSVVDSLVEV